MNKKQYANYLEQVTDNLELIDLCNDLNEIDEFYYEGLTTAIDEAISDEEILANCQNLTEEEQDTSTDQFSELRSEYVFECAGDAYQLWQVSIKGKFGPEHQRLCVFYNEELESYVLPVFHFGTSWKYVGPCN